MSVMDPHLFMDRVAGKVCVEDVHDLTYRYSLADGFAGFECQSCRSLFLLQPDPPAAALSAEEGELGPIAATNAVTVAALSHPAGTCMCGRPIEEHLPLGQCPPSVPSPVPAGTEREAAFEQAFREWFHGTDAAPYTAPGHAEDRDDCWHCGEAAERAAAVVSSSPATPAGDQPERCTSTSHGYRCELVVGHTEWHESANGTESWNYGGPAPSPASPAETREGLEIRVAAPLREWLASTAGSTAGWHYVDTQDAVRLLDIVVDLASPAVSLPGEEEKP